MTAPSRSRLAGAGRRARPRTGPPHGRRRRDPAGIADVAARHAGLRHRRPLVAEVPQDRAPTTRRALDERPHRPVLAPARTLAVRRRRAACRTRPRVERPLDPAAHAVRRRRSRVHDAGAHEMADDRANLVGLLAARPEDRRELVGADVVAPVDRARLQPVRDGRDRLVGQLAALDEEDVQPLVAALGEQQRTRRQAVAPGTAGLLVVRLDRAGDALVADRAHVGLVDPHPEGVRRHDDGQLAVHEAALHARALHRARAPRGRRRRRPRASSRASRRASRLRPACPRRRSRASHPARTARPRCGGAWPSRSRTG